MLRNLHRLNKGRAGQNGEFFLIYDVIVKQKYKKRPANHLFRRRRHLVIFSQILWSNNRAAQITQCWRSVIVEELNPKP